MSLAIVTPPDENKFAIELDLLKKQIHILPSETDEDDLLKLYIKSATEEFESYTGRAVLKQRLRQSFDKFPCEPCFNLERANNVELVSFEFANNLGVFADVDSDIYVLDSDSLCPRICLNNNQTWPINRATSQFNAVRLVYDCGYGEDAANVPAGVQHIIAMIAADSYVHREDTEISPGVVSVKVTWTSLNMMNKYKTHYCPFRSQSL